MARLHPPARWGAVNAALGAKTWQLGLTIGVAQRPRERHSLAGDIAQLPQEITPATKLRGLREETRVVSCYEAGRERCWLHRCLVAHGVENRVVDSASIEGNRRQRRAKTAPRHLPAPPSSPCPRRICVLLLGHDLSPLTSCTLLLLGACLSQRLPRCGPHLAHGHHDAVVHVLPDDAHLPEPRIT